MPHEKPLIASWPHLSPLSVATATTQSPLPRCSYAASQSKLQTQLLQFIRQQRKLVEGSHDDETLSVIHSQLLDECCRRLARHLTAYNDVFEAMVQSIQALSDVLERSMEKLELQGRSIEDAQRQVELSRRQSLLVASEFESSFKKLQMTRESTTREADSVRVIQTQNQDLFDQLQKLKRRVAEAEELSTQMSARNLVLQVNQGRLENEIQKLTERLEQSQASHDADLKVLEMKKTIIETHEQRIANLTGRLETAEGTVEKLVGDHTRLRESNVSLTFQLHRVKTQLHNLEAPPAALPARTSPVNPVLSALGRPKHPETPRPDWQPFHADLEISRSSQEMAKSVARLVGDLKQRIVTLEGELLAASQQHQPANDAPRAASPKKRRMVDVFAKSEQSQGENSVLNAPLEEELVIEFTPDDLECLPLLFTEIAKVTEVSGLRGHFHVGFTDALTVVTDLLQLPPSVSQESVGRSMIRACQRADGSDVYPMMLLLHLSAAVPSETFLSLRRHLTRLKLILMGGNDSGPVSSYVPRDRFVAVVRSEWNFLDAVGLTALDKGVSFEHYERISVEDVDHPKRPLHCLLATLFLRCAVRCTGEIREAVAELSAGAGGSPPPVAVLAVKLSELDHRNSDASLRAKCESGWEKLLTEAKNVNDLFRTHLFLWPSKKETETVSLRAELPRLIVKAKEKEKEPEPSLARRASIKGKRKSIV